MPEPAAHPIQLTPVQRKLVLHWGEMGTRWGINRTIAQVHALLYLWPEPLHAEQLQHALGVARSNVSTSLRELQGWGIVRVVHTLGDRRDYFASMTDPWEMFQVILDERKAREIDPTLAVLRDCVEEAKTSKHESEHTRRQLAELLSFMQTMTAWYEQLRKLPRPAMVRFFKLGAKLRRWLGSEGAKA